MAHNSETPERCVRIGNFPHRGRLPLAFPVTQTPRIDTATGPDWRGQLAHKKHGPQKSANGMAAYAPSERLAQR